MSGRLNPRKYDLGELRDAVRGSSRRQGSRRASRGGTGEDVRPAPSSESDDSSGTTDSDRSSSAAHRSTEAAVSNRDLELLAQLSRRGLARPYLDRLPDEYSAQLEIFEWLEGLVATASREGALDALEYYESIGWLSERSHDHLVAFLEGLPADDASDTRQLSVDDHRGSLLYVARLAHRLY